MKRNKGISQSKKPKMSNVGTVILYVFHILLQVVLRILSQEERASLGMKGLTGKIHLYSDMNEDNIKREII